MTTPAIDARDIETLIRVAGVLTPGSGTMPAPREIDAFPALVRTAIKASAIAEADIKAALEALPADLDAASVRAYSAAHPAMFETLALIASGAYVMAPVVLERLGFPADRRQPAGPMDAADEYETGILEPVIGRGPRFRDPRVRDGS